MGVNDLAVLTEWVRGGGLDPGGPLGVITQADADRALESVRVALVSADSALSWCVHRHRADEETKAAASEVARLVRSR